MTEKQALAWLVNLCGDRLFPRGDSYVRCVDCIEHAATRNEIIHASWCRVAATLRLARCDSGVKIKPDVAESKGEK